MRTKMLAGMFLFLLLLLGFTVSASATLTPEAERQFGLLQELMDETVVESFTARVGFNVPRVNLIIPMEGDREYFMIGVANEPTPECIEFILAYTGIPRERAFIGKGGFEFEGGIPPGHIYDLLPSNERVEVAPRQSWWGMGQLIWIDGAGMFTMGHPLNPNSISFATAPHQGWLTNRNVFIHGTNQLIGTVRTSVFQHNMDVALINLHSPNFISPVVQGGAISDYQARAFLNDSVVSVSGRQWRSINKIYVSGGQGSVGYLRRLV